MYMTLDMALSLYPDTVSEPQTKLFTVRYPTFLYPLRAELLTFNLVRHHKKTRK